MIEAEHTMVALHHGDPAVGPHDPGRGHGHRPGDRIDELHGPRNSALAVGDVEREAGSREPVRTDAHVEGVACGLELGSGVAVIGGVAGRAVEHLDERVVMLRIVAEEDPGDDRQPVLLGGVDQLVVPPLEKRRLAAVPVVALGVEEVAHHAARPYPDEPLRSGLGSLRATPDSRLPTQSKWQVAPLAQAGAP